jgi:1-phosphofructokinase family hexose kinase
MFLCVSLNPAIDKRMHIAELRVGEVNRVSNAISAPGGKAAHVAMVLHELGCNPVWLGFAGGASGQEQLAGLQEIGVRIQAVKSASATRVNLELIDDQRNLTEILEPGGSISGMEMSEMLNACEGIFVKEKSNLTVIFSGSLPPGAPDDTYARLTRMAHAHGCRVLLDTSGEALSLALREQPEFVKPNREEAQAFTGQEIPNIESAKHAIDMFLAAGARSVAISLGKDGLLWRPGMNARVYYAKACNVPIVSTVGCGDATVAGFAWATANGLTEESTMRWAVACGAANCVAQLPGRIRADDVRAIGNGVEVVTTP